jgi:ribosomally synthesized peptide (two-chain TOMM family)
MGMDDMMRFRTSYLEAIARAWVDEKFFHAMTDKNAKGYDGWRFLRRPRPHWNVELAFGVDTLPGNGFRPELTGSWVGPKALLSLCFPQAPVIEQQAEALAAYYKAMPSPFGQGHPSADPWDEREQHQQPLGDSDGSAGSGMGHWSDALVLGGTLVRALALSWSEPLFCEQFFGGRALDALQNWLGYTLPWNMDLQAEPARDMKWNGRAWTPMPRNRLTLWVPNRPETKHRALALAAYNQTGDAYPLTCP